MIFYAYTGPAVSLTRLDMARLDSGAVRSVLAHEQDSAPCDTLWHHNGPTARRHLTAPRKVRALRSEARAFLASEGRASRSLATLATTRGNGATARPLSSRSLAQALATRDGPAWIVLAEDFPGAPCGTCGRHEDCAH